jgi:hypothetical protein
VLGSDVCETFDVLVLLLLLPLLSVLPDAPLVARAPPLLLLPFTVCWE